MDLENHQVIGAADEYERQTGQEFPHKRRARLQFALCNSMPIPIAILPRRNEDIKQRIDAIQDNLDLLHAQFMKDNHHWFDFE